MSQRKYIIDMVTETSLMESKPVDTPIEENHKLGYKKEEVPVDKGTYQMLMGRLIYLSHTRPDISYVVGVVNQFMHEPYEEHLRAVHHILRYLKGTPRKVFFFKKNINLRKIEAFTDIDWARLTSDRSWIRWFASCRVVRF